MDIKQDPNSIPNFNSSGRIGELQAGEPEQAQSSVQLDPEADGDGAASGELSTGSHDEAQAASRQDTAGGQDDVKSPDAGRTETGRDPEAKPVDPSKTGAGAIDGLVGAP
jgi:hypothetical protein